LSLYSLRVRGATSLYSPSASAISLIDDDGSEAMVAMATAAATWTDSARREPGWLITS